MRLSLIVAIAENRVIGKDGALPWHLSADLRRFKRITMGHPLVMGRVTFESIGRPLPGRTSLVISRQPEWSSPGVIVARDLDAAIAVAGPAHELFVIGGAAIYALALPRADRIYLTRVLAQVEGDTFFPEWVETEWVTSHRESHLADSSNDHDHVFEILDRIHTR